MKAVAYPWEEVGTATKSAISGYDDYVKYKRTSRDGKTVVEIQPKYQGYQPDYYKDAQPVWRWYISSINYGTKWNGFGSHGEADSILAAKCAADERLEEWGWTLARDRLLCMK